MSFGIPCNTFSVNCFDPETGMFGIAVSTAIPGVGMLCPFAKAGVGSIATQAYVNPAFGPVGLRLLESGLSAQETLDKLLEMDEGREVRQLTVIDNQGRSAAFSGKDCVDWFGHLNGQNWACAGNMLVGKETIEAMAESISTSKGELADRLLAALQAGQDAGGDKRGKVSSALLVVKDEPEYPYISLRVDDHPNPVPELQRVYQSFKEKTMVFFYRFAQRTPNGWR